MKIKKLLELITNLNIIKENTIYIFNNIRKQILNLLEKIDKIK